MCVHFMFSALPSPSSPPLSPSLLLSRISGGDIPVDAIISGSTLTIPNPEEGDSGDYVCTSREGSEDEANFIFSLLVLPRPTDPAPTGSPSSSPTITNG